MNLLNLILAIAAFVATAFAAIGMFRINKIASGLFTFSSVMWLVVSVLRLYSLMSQ